MCYLNGSASAPRSNVEPTRPVPVLKPMLMRRRLVSAQKRTYAVNMRGVGMARQSRCNKGGQVDEGSSLSDVAGAVLGGIIKASMSP